MRKINRFMAVALTVAMSAGLMACGGGSATTTTKAAAATTAATTKAAATTAGATTKAAATTAGATTKAAAATTAKAAASGGSGSKELSLYTAYPEAEVIYYCNAFEKATGIKVNYVRLSAGEMLTRVAAEKDNPKASLMFGGSTDNYIAANTQGLLDAYQSPNLSDTPKEYLDSSGVWDPIYVGCIAFACNKDWFKSKGYDYPKSWQDLLDPKFKGQIVMAHPATSGTAYTVLATLVQLMKEDAAFDYLNKLKPNISQFTKSGAAAPNAVALGEAAIAITFSHDGLQPTAEGYPIELSFPSEGTGYEVGAVALIKNGPKAEQENAKKFIDWICSKDGQSLYAENKSFRVPTNTKAKVADGLVTLDKVKTIKYDAKWAADNKKDLTAKFESKVSNASEAKDKK